MQMRATQHFHRGLLLLRTPDPRSDALSCKLLRCSPPAAVDSVLFGSGVVYSLHCASPQAIRSLAAPAVGEARSGAPSVDPADRGHRARRVTPRTARLGVR